MTIVFRSSDESGSPARPILWRDFIYAEVKAMVQGEALRFERLERFLALRGMFADDAAFDQAMELMDRKWRAWAGPSSA